jgi:hypothetical protein
VFQRHNHFKIKKIYIHIGPHKTGTTSFQKFCFQNKDILKEQGIYYPNMLMESNETEHSRLVDLIQKSQIKQIPSLVKEITKNINKPNNNKILFSSEKFMELAMHDVNKMQLFLDEIGKEYEVIIIYIKRNIFEIVDSGVRHFLSIMSRKNNLYYAKYFEFNINPINYYFDFNEVKDSMLKWIKNAYFIIDKINIKKISIDHNEENIPIILKEIFEKDHKLFMNFFPIDSERFNSYPVDDHKKLKEYKEFCKKNFCSNQFIQLISYNEYKDLNV